MRIAVPLVIAACAFGGARLAHGLAIAARTGGAIDDPFVPGPDALPFVSLGYREATADLLFIRLRGYFGGGADRADLVASLVEDIAAIDPKFHRIYEYGAHAMTLAQQGVDQPIYLRALALLERGRQEFPDDWRLPMLAGQILTQDLVTDDPAQRRAWQEAGTRLIEAAVRKPGAPAGAAEAAAVMWTRLGQHQRAVDGIREVLLLTTDETARKALLARLATLENENAEAIAGEIYESRHHFEIAWKRDRPGVPPTWYVLLGPRLVPGFDLGDLATGGHDLVEPLPQDREPLTPP